MSSTTLQVAQHFQPGTKVTVAVRAADFYNGAPGVKTTTVPDDGEVKLTGLEPHADYWLVADGKTVAFTATGPASDTLADEIAAKADANAKVRGDVGSPVGAGAVDVPADIPKSNFEKSDSAEAHPRAKQVDVPKGTPQRTDTPLGTAYPVDPSEIQPQPGKEHVKAGPQRDGAELGYATPVAPGEVQPALKYEEQKGPQRLGADTGQAEPIAKGPLTAQDEVKDSSVSKAKGATVPKKGTAKKAKAKGDPVKASAKRTARKGA